MRPRPGPRKHSNKWYGYGVTGISDCCSRVVFCVAKHHPSAPCTRDDIANATFGRSQTKTTIARLPACLLSPFAHRLEKRPSIVLLFPASSAWTRVGADGVAPRDLRCTSPAGCLELREDQKAWRLVRRESQVLCFFSLGRHREKKVSQTNLPPSNGTTTPATSTSPCLSSSRFPHHGTIKVSHERLCAACVRSICQPDGQAPGRSIRSNQYINMLAARSCPDRRLASKKNERLSRIGCAFW